MQKAVSDKQKKLQEAVREQWRAVTAGKGTSQLPVQATGGSPAAGKLPTKRSHQANEALFRKYILPNTAGQQHDYLAREIASGGRLPVGSQWHRTGNTA